LSAQVVERLGQAEVDDFRSHSASLVRTHHYVGGFDISVDELLFVHRSQTRGDLHDNFQRQLDLKATRAPDQALQCLPLYKLHRIEIVPASSAQVKDRGNIRVTHAGGGTCLAQETKLS
jgi:hypothetical protein